ncbi:alkaline-phosphatase-like protein [Cokeromyces recurvatus]|uniref:alkaline-phosphatase-like protein n=1 Tax=Cokeromyces recurvatus TaxID=90255 RepID=UPI00221F2DD5|nr:alkaline-phosphatase-like protein [Cokeromyces recurvatus]KAI7905893.1 alkaline-phosphatase-like protein [Cokeromyces recurvatus]
MIDNRSNYSSIPNDEEAIVQKKTSTNNKKLHLTVRFILYGAIAFVIVFTLLFFRNKRNKSASVSSKRNVIMMISDGFGPASETFARQYYAWAEKKDIGFMLPLDEIHVGNSRTQSSSSLITDSAAGATAFSCAKKSYNGAIGVDPEKVPCGTVLESAKIHKNMLTGLVVTSRVTHATPASFSAHVGWRDWENQIAEQQIGYTPLGRTVDLIFGGGLCEFTKNSSEGSCRADDRDLLTEAKKNFGWHIVLSKEEYEELDSQNASLPLMALFAPNHMSYEMDRNPLHQPALHEMTAKALDILKTKSLEQDTGFFLMIEGSRIDMAAHANDPAAHFYDIMEYQRTVALVKQFVEDNPNTVLISTSDHETGGFTAGRQIGDNYPEYLWNPHIIHRVRNSSEALAIAWNDIVHKEEDDVQSYNYLREVLIEIGLGILDATRDEIEKLKAWKLAKKTLDDLGYLFADMVSRRALIGWSTHGHTAVDVNLYAKGEGTEVLRGSHENIEIGEFIVNYLDLDLEDITKRLR